MFQHISIRNMAYILVLTAALLIVPFLIIAPAWTDLDWMIVCYKFQIGQGTAVAQIWEFCPALKMEWWTAFEFTLTRLVIGSVLEGVFFVILIQKLLSKSKCQFMCCTLPENTVCAAPCE